MSISKHQLSQCAYVYMGVTRIVPNLICLTQTSRERHVLLLEKLGNSLKNVNSMSLMVCPAEKGLTRVEYTII